MLSVADAKDRNSILEEANINTRKPGVSPARRLDRQLDRRPHQVETSTGHDIRTYDGSGNNETVTDMGSSHVQLTRMVPDDYADGISAMAGASRPSARVISNILSAQSDTMPNSH